MFDLSDKLAGLISGKHKNLKKEKKAENLSFKPGLASGFKENSGLGKVNNPAQDTNKDNLILTDKPQNRTVAPVLNNTVKNVSKNPGVKIAYKRNTGVTDSNGFPYTNTDDVLLLNKLGYSVDKDYYLFLPRGEEREDLYSYIEKTAGVSREVSQAIDEGKSFSGEYLKDMDYNVPEGYEVKGDLCCPVEKTAEEEKESSEKTAAIGDTAPSMSLNTGPLQATHSPINIQTSTSGQTTPIDYDAKNKALAAAGKSFLTDQMIGTVPSVFRGAANIVRGIAPAGRLGNRVIAGANKLEAAGHIGAGELAAGQADDPRTANVDRALSYASSAVPLVTKNPLVGGLAYAGNTLYDIANAADVYHKNISSAPPSMGKVPDQNFNINLKKEQPTPDFRLTQPELREQPGLHGSMLAKKGSTFDKKAAATHELKSSNIKAVGYNKEDKSLDVAFHSGGEYTYKDVPKSLFDRIKKVKSPGKFFHKHIKKNNSYKYSKLEKEAALGGTVVNLPGIQRSSPALPERLGAFIFGKNYIPQPVNGESVYDAMLRSKRNSDMLNISKETFANNPLFQRLGLNNSKIAPLLGIADYMTQGKLSNIASPINHGNIYQANQNIQEMLNNPAIMSQFKQAEEKQPSLPGIAKWVKKQPFNYAEDAYKHGRIPKHVRDDIVSGRAAEMYRPRFKEMLDKIRNSGLKRAADYSLLEKTGSPRWVSEFEKLNPENQKKIVDIQNRERFLRPLGKGSSNVSDLVVVPKEGLQVRKLPRIHQYAPIGSFGQITSRPTVSPESVDISMKHRDRQVRAEELLRSIANNSGPFAHLQKTVKAGPFSNAIAYYQYAQGEHHPDFLAAKDNVDISQKVYGSNWPKKISKQEYSSIRKAYTDEQAHLLGYQGKRVIDEMLRRGYDMWDMRHPNIVGGKLVDFEINNNLQEKERDLQTMPGQASGARKYSRMPDNNIRKYWLERRLKENPLDFFKENPNLGLGFLGNPDSDTVPYLKKLKQKPKDLKKTRGGFADYIREDFPIIVKKPKAPEANYKSFIAKLQKQISINNALKTIKNRILQSLKLR